MELGEKLRALRKRSGLSQEELADNLGISRQTASKWENGQAVPGLEGLVALSDFYGVPIDGIVRGCCCGPSLALSENEDVPGLADFLVEAKRSTYAAKGKECAPSRRGSHDYSYEDGSGLYYHDTYIGGEMFAGEEAVWLLSNPLWGMNYAGRVTGGGFSGDFLKDALLGVSREKPFRGPEIFHKGDYLYHCTAEGGIGWFAGREEIFLCGTRIYECRFHGGRLG